ncbi:MAG: hypothetical protein RSB82_03950 [Victivallaceae bacterium]
MNVSDSILDVFKENAFFFFNEMVLYWETDYLLKNSDLKPLCISDVKTKPTQEKLPQSIKRTDSEIPVPATKSRKTVSSKNSELSNEGDNRRDLSTNWILNPMTHCPSTEDFLNLEFKCLKSINLRQLRIPVCLYLFAASTLEILFFQRLVKSVTQFFVPCRLSLSHEKQFNSEEHFGDHELILIKQETLIVNFQDTIIHQPYEYKQKIIIPLLSFEDYQKDVQTKKALWIQLRQLTMSVTPK